MSFFSNVDNDEKLLISTNDSNDFVLPGENEINIIKKDSIDIFFDKESKGKEIQNLNLIYPNELEVPISFIGEYGVIKNYYFSPNVINSFFQDIKNQEMLKNVDSLKMLNCKFPTVESIKLFFQLLDENYKIIRLKFEDMNLLNFFTQEEVFNSYEYIFLSFEKCTGLNKIKPIVFSNFITKNSKLKFLNIVNCKIDSSFIKEMFESLEKEGNIPLLREINLSNNALCKKIEDLKNLKPLFEISLRLTTLKVLNLKNTGISNTFVLKIENKIKEYHEIKILDGFLKVEKKQENNLKFESEINEEKKGKCCSSILCCKCSFNISFFQRRGEREGANVANVFSFQQ